jgi:hypothetical protein
LENLVARQTAKQQALEAVQNLPENASLEDAIDRLLFLSKVRRGLEQVQTQQVVPHDEAKARILK